MNSFLIPDTYDRLKENKSFIEEVAYLLRRYLDKNGMSYEFAIGEAIKDAVGLISIEGV